MGKYGDSSLETRLRQCLERQEVVLLHNVLTMPFHLPLMAALCILAEELRTVRFIGWIHDLAAANPDYGELFTSDRPDLRLLRQAHPHVEYVAVSRARQEQFCQLTEWGRCRVIPNGIDPVAHLRLAPTLGPLVAEWRLLERSLVVLHPARLLRRKNVEASLALADALRDLEGPGSLGSVLLLTGARDPHQARTTEYEQELRAQIRTQHLEQQVCWVSDYAPVGEAEIASLYTVADALFFPSKQEGFGLPVLEAALHRLPIYCLDVEPMRSLFPVGAITVFSPEAPSLEIAREMMRQAGASQAIHNRKAVVSQYSWPAIYEKFLAPLLAGSETPDLP